MPGLPVKYTARRIFIPAGPRRHFYVQNTSEGTASGTLASQRQLTTITKQIRSAAGRLYRSALLPFFTLLLLASLWADTVYQEDQARDIARFEAVMHSHAMARTLAEHAGHILRQADHATQLFKLKYEETGGTLRLAEFSKKNGLLDSLMPSRLELPIALLDAEGNVVDKQHGYFAANMAQEAFFKTLAGSTDDTALTSNPMVEPKTKKWQVQIARRLNHADGRFAGAILLMIDPAYFVDDYDRLHLGAKGLVMLTSRDTGLSIGRVDETLFISDQLDFVAPADPTAIPEELKFNRPYDNVPRIYSFREMPRYSLVAVVGNSEATEMANFVRQRRLNYLSMVLAGAAILGFAVLLGRQSRRLRSSMRDATEAQQMMRAAGDASLDAMFIMKACRSGSRNGEVLDFTLLDVNERAARILRHPRGEVLGLRIGELLPHWKDEGFIDKYRMVLDTGKPMEEEIETQPPGEEMLWLRHQIVAIEDGVAVTVRNITARKRSELEIRKSQAELTALMDASPLGLIRTDRDFHCTYVNRTFEAITGLAREKARDDGWMCAVHPDDRDVLREALQHLAGTRTPYQDSLRCLQPDGTLVWTSIKIAPILVDSRIDGFVCTLEDITVVRKSVMALRESEARLRTITDTLPAMVAYVDQEEIYRFNNLAYEREFSRTGLNVVGLSVQETVGGQRYEFLRPYIRRALHGETLTFEEDGESENEGVLRTYEVVYIPQFDADGATVIGFHVMRQDISAQKREKQRLLKLSQVDALTGLTNRAGFLQRLNESMLYCRDNASMMAVMYMDIDRFKPVNDTYGHAVGDALLKAFSARLTHTMRASDTVARLGGDEFTIIMERISRADDASILAGKIVKAMQAPFELDGITVSVSTSIGLTYYSDEDLSPAELLKRADVLLYDAKQAGRNTYRAGALLPDAA